MAGDSGDGLNLAQSPNPTHRGHLLERLSAALAKARSHYRAELVSRIGEIYDRFIDEGLADLHFTKQIIDPNDYVHEQRMAELLLADHLWGLGFSLKSQTVGPDFLATKDGMSAWIELITPTPAGIDPAWLTPSPEGVWNYPHAEIALRYTAALKEKQEKLVGNGKGKLGYLAQGIVGKHDIYVIAVNQHLLQPSFRTLSGISSIPTACEILFAVGPQQLHLDRTSGAVLDRGHAHRPKIPKAGGVKVPADSFLSPAYAQVSAVFAVDLVLEKFITPDSDHFLMREDLSAMVYNPSAANPLRSHWIPAQSHWTAKIGGDAIEVLPV